MVVMADKLAVLAGAQASSCKKDLMTSQTPYIAVLCSVAFAASAQAAESVRFAPHRAVYDIELSNAATGSGVSALEGRMVYELSGSACEGYTQNMRFVTRMTNQEGGESVTDLRNSSWEEANGKRLRFSSSQYANDKLVEGSQGDARHDDAAVKVELAKPQKGKLSLAASTLFPMQHARSLIEAAKAGRTLVTAHIYDGSEKGNKVYLTSAVIGKAAPPGATTSLAALKVADRMAKLESWPMSISYFETGNDHQDVPPAYELTYRFYENGVTADLQIDYGEFAIKGKLKDLTFLPESDCGADQH